MTIEWATQLSPQEQQQPEAEQGEPCEKTRKVAYTGRAKYLALASVSASGSDKCKSAKEEMYRYINMQHEFQKSPDGSLQELDPIAFWLSNSEDLPRLAKLANLVMGVPASSASVERVFSHGGIIFRPHRRRLTDEHLSQLIYLKCNCLT